MDGAAGQGGGGGDGVSKPFKVNLITNCIRASRNRISCMSDFTISKLIEWYVVLQKNDTLPAEYKPIRSGHLSLDGDICKFRSYAGDRTPLETYNCRCNQFQTKFLLNNSPNGSDVIGRIFCNPGFDRSQRRMFLLMVGTVGIDVVSIDKTPVDP